ncbi:hypothetical protein ACWCPD_16160 [Streptomyces sp. NPDC001935]
MTKALPLGSRQGLRAVQDARSSSSGEGGGMISALPIIVYPPDEQGGRRVRMDGEILGLAYSLRDIAEFLPRAGLPDPDPAWVEASTLIEWRGGGPEAWEH